MDTNESANKMINIVLVKEGKYLSGRSIAKELVDNVGRDNLAEAIVELNFDGVETCSQSFLSELIYRLKEKGLKPGSVHSSSLTNETVAIRLKNEIKRLEMGPS